MKIGLLAYSTNTGLGYQTRDFYKHFGADKVLIVDLSIYNYMPVDHSWIDSYTPHHMIVKGIPSDKDCEWLVDGMDVVFVCETPLNYHLFEYAARKGVKTVQQYNYEFLDYFRKPYLPKPTVLASPSYWGIDRVKALGITDVKYWPVPVDTSTIKPRTINKVETFFHITGRPAAYDRNGTIPFLKAVKALHLYYPGKYQFKLYIQPPLDPRAQEHYKPIQEAIAESIAFLGGNLTIITNTKNNLDMYKDGDILVLPRRYGGLCLPMWEALAHGIPVIMTNVSPNNAVLPQEWLVESSIKGSFMAHTDITIYEPDLLQLGRVMEASAHSIQEDCLTALLLAQDMSWDMQKPEYLK